MSNQTPGFGNGMNGTMPIRLPTELIRIPHMDVAEMPAHPSLEQMVVISGIRDSMLPDTARYGQDGSVAKAGYEYSNTGSYKTTTTIDEFGRPAQKMIRLPSTASTEVSVLEDGSIRLTDIIEEKGEGKTPNIAELLFKKIGDKYSIFQDGYELGIGNAAELINQTAQTIRKVAAFKAEYSNPAFDKAVYALTDALKNLQVEIHAQAAEKPAGV
jgi:hypothetical protein